MKHRLLPVFVVIIAIFYSNALSAQCGDRYMMPVFSSVSTVANVQYGSNITAEGQNKILQFDFYEPQGDTLSARPLIILAHGGTFVAGDENSADIVFLCQEFAKRGYACASINYRLLSTTYALTAMLSGELTNVFFDEVVKAVTDMRAAIRYFRQDAANGNAYRIDPNQIFVGGASAGAITALHAAYLSSESDFDNYTLAGVVPMDYINSNGGFEGTSGNAGYSSAVSGIINLCGALGSVTFMQAGEVPVVSLHGDADSVVPYGTGSANAFGIPVIQVDGSEIIQQRANELNIPNDLLTFPGQDHMAHDSPANRPQSVAFITNFLYNLVDCSNLQVGITPTHNTAAQAAISLYPNPVGSNAEITLSFTGFTGQQLTVQLYNQLGQKIWQTNAPANSMITMPTAQLPAGMYEIIATDGTQMNTRKLMVAR
ncbi:T9SS C-terminal target domain-containing protein [Sphingobacteriales bacterium UPWRP_1]|nr:hypothetical protein B6N25_00485 [Sphingobacteriales bacterium TSM_CSS]PSJ71923.1 T9SS C-terminal target domain-containing protein [Sphingobacteriales bacterium UPWRP_1]